MKITGSNFNPVTAREYIDEVMEGCRGIAGALPKMDHASPLFALVDEHMDLAADNFESGTGRQVDLAKLVHDLVVDQPNHQQLVVQDIWAEPDDNFVVSDTSSMVIGRDGAVYRTLNKYDITRDKISECLKATFSFRFVVTLIDVLVDLRADDPRSIIESAEWVIVSAYDRQGFLGISPRDLSQ